MAEEKPIRVYGSDIELKMIKEAARNNHLSVSTFLRKLALSEINRHKKNKPLEDVIEIKVEEGIKKYFEQEALKKVNLN